MMQPGDMLQSPGGAFSYEVTGPCCRLYDREQLPWPCCRLSWRGKEPSWKRVGSRLVADMAVRRYPSYSVTGRDRYGCMWQSVVTDFSTLLPRDLARWWYARRPPSGSTWPLLPDEHGESM